MRIAFEQGWQLGREVGYHVRFDRQLTAQTRLRVVTEGILTRQLLDDPLLEGVGCVVLDEFHERSLHTDLAAALLKEVLEARPDMKVVVMSATLDAAPIAQYFNDAPVVHSQGRSFPVDVSYRAPATGSRVRLEQQIAAAAEAVFEDADDGGDVLIFLPGAAEIRRAMTALQPLASRHGVDVLPLYGSLAAEAQMRAIEPSSRRRIICATNVAETSLTIEGVTTVIDSGLARVARYDPRRGLDHLELATISRASAQQRAGRAGRVRAGRCIRLYSETHYHAMAAFELPEVQRVDLAQTVLTLHAWGRRDVRGFMWYQPPPEAMVAAAERLLALLGALDGESQGRMTDLGRRMLALPVHPRLARLLLAAADAGFADLGATVAALLSERDILLAERGSSFGHGDRRASAGTSQSDLIARIAVLDTAERDRFNARLRSSGIDPAAAQQVARVRDSLQRLMPRRREAITPAHAEPDETLLLKLPLLAYPDRVCRRRDADDAAGAMVGGGGVRLAPESTVRDSALFVAIDARQDERTARREAQVRIASAIDPAWLEELFPHAVRRERSAVYDEGRQRAVGVMRVWYRDLLLREAETGQVDAAAAELALRTALQPRAKELVAGNEAAASLLARLAFLKAVLPAKAWPDGATPAFDADALVAAACAGARSLDDVTRRLPQIIDTEMGYALRRFIDEHAPESLAAATGNRIKLDWSAARADDAASAVGPIMAVRLQEMFGMADTPRLAMGRVPVVLHLLGPNYRPVQVTSDLASFWKNTYPQVRKDLRARYPKHAWPDDPLTAPPEARGGRRRQ
jgi:ATP-dependent helicase HrpB